MKKYVKNLLYILQHKWYVFCECWKEGLCIQGIFHDMSKFSKIEFISYAWHFFSKEKKYPGQNREHFQYAWLHHQHKNKHHWNYWVYDQANQKALEMPYKYMVEMICDWRAMGRKFGDTAKDFFIKHEHDIILHPATKRNVLYILNILEAERT